MTDSMADQAAHVMLQRFNRFYQCFLDVTRGAQERFEEANWLGVQLASRERIRLYDHHATEARAEIKALTGHLQRSDAFSAQVKTAYSELLKQHDNFEVAESFFNSVYQRLFHHRYIREDQLFIRAHRTSHLVDYQVILHHFEGNQLHELLHALITSYQFELPFEDLQRDIGWVVAKLEQHSAINQANWLKLDFVKAVFFRNKGAYLIGRIDCGEESVPIALPILHGGDSLYIDTVLSSSDDVSILFGFARSYFMVDAPAPRRIVNFLKLLMPNKTDYELFTAIGCQKHGKTEFYRHYLSHLNNSSDQFELAPGIKGMVMSVFTLPSYDVVFKIIKDKFTPPKEVSHAVVKEKYRIVKQHDRVGRMADTQEFSNFDFPLERFSTELIEELQKVAPSALQIDGDTITIKHLYTERKMIPLNMFLDDADEPQAKAAIEEYGNAIKQLAAANIFPGDMLFKNFGVTRHGRVIFYDYDEICYMTECNFRDIPPPRYPEDEWAAEPWYSVGPNDVFPEEFATFLMGRPLVRKVFSEVHSDLFKAGYWRDRQKNIEKGKFEDVFPYRRTQRFQAR